MSKIDRLNEFAKGIGHAASPVRRWEQEGWLIVKRLPSGHRSFDESDVRAMLGAAPESREASDGCLLSRRQLWPA